MIGSVAKGDLSQTMVLEVDGRPLRGEALRLGTVVNTMVGQLNGFAARSLARRARGRHRRQARRPGAGARRRGRVEGPHRQRELDGGEPHRPGAQHRRGDDRGRQGRPVEEDHRRRKGEILELKSTINTMVDQLNAFAARGIARGAAKSAPKASSAARRR